MTQQTVVLVPTGQVSHCLTGDARQLRAYQTFTQNQFRYCQKGAVPLEDILQFDQLVPEAMTVHRSLHALVMNVSARQ
jgi:hypothetical protein